MNLDRLNASAGTEYISLNMRQQAEKLLGTAGRRTDPFEGRYFANVRRLLVTGLSLREARRRKIPVADLIDYRSLSRPVKESNGRTSIVTLWSETLIPEESPIIRLKKGLSSPLELTKRGGAITWSYETQISYPPPALYSYPSYRQRIEIHRLVQSEVSGEDLKMWQDVLEGLAREAFKIF